jgi:uncharacterized membrane protein (UPF0127 family)
MRMVNATTGQVVAERLEIADTFWRRLRGLQFRRPLPPGNGLLLMPCNGVHTCFVRGVIDVVALDRQNRVVGVRRGVRPWRIVLPFPGAHSMLELPAGAISFSIGDLLCMERT